MQSTRYQIFNHALRLGALCLLLLLAGGSVAAQTPQPDKPTVPPAGEGQPVEPVVPDGPEKMSFQPSANARAVTDFAPPRAQLIDGQVVAQEVTAFNQESMANARAGFATQTIALNTRRDNAVRLANDKLNIIVEKDTFAQPVGLEVRGLTVASNPPLTRMVDGQEVRTQENTTLMRFELEMVDGQNRQINGFDKNVRLVVDMRDHGIDVSQDGGYFYLAYEDEKEPGKWLEVPITAYDDTGLISAEVSHFSDWQAGWRPEAWALEWRPPSVSEFTGAASYQYPIQLPPGRAGLQPSVGLSYSSASLRGAIQKVSFGNVATGWSLNDIQIIRTGITNGAVLWDFPNSFRLSVNGVGGRLISVGSEDGVPVYRVEDQPQFKVYNYGGTHLQPDHGQGDSYWVVKDGSGTQYRLGYTADAYSYQGADSTDSNTTYDAVDIISWHVDTITDAHGNQVTYDYSRYTRSETTAGQWCPWGGGGYICLWHIDTHNSQVSQIQYNFAARVQTAITHDVPRLSGNAASKIVFYYNDSANGRYLQSVDVYHGGLSAPMRRYVIDAQMVGITNNNWTCDTPNGNQRTTQTRVINWIEEQAIDPNTGAIIAALPKTTFSYQTLHNFGGVTGVPACYLYQYLDTVENGYGGRSEFTYVSDGRTEGYQRNCRDGSNPCTPSTPAMGYNYSVGTVTHYDGINNGVKTEYSYADRCYDQHGNNGTKCPQPDTNDDLQLGNIGGYGQVTVTTYDYDGTTALTKRITEYHNDYDENDPTVMARYGRPQQVQVVDPITLAPFSRTETDYVVGSFGPSNNIRFTYASTITNTQFDGSNSLYTKVNNYYETTYQGGQQWGMLTRQDNYYQDVDGTEAFAGMKITRFVTNDNDWIIVPWNEGVHKSQADQYEAVQKTFYLYDGNTNQIDTQPISKGELTLVRNVLVDDPTEFPGTGTTYNTVDTSFTYDQFGNQETITNYDVYGEVGFNTANHWTHSGIPLPSTAHTTTLAYDSTYNLYPVSTSGPVTGYSTNFDIYGFNGVTLEGLHTPPGLLKSVTDPNNLTSTYEYDPFGRLYATYEHGDNRGSATVAGDGSPAKRYRYWDNTWNSSSSSPFSWNGPIDPTVLPGTDEIQTQSAYVVADTFYQGIWRNSEAWSRTIPIVDGAIDWDNASNWNGPASISILPGSGEIQSQVAYVIGNTLHQGFWRGNQSWSRTVPIVAGTPDFGNATAWSGPGTAVPGTGDIQSQTAYVIDDTLYQSVWQGDSGYARTVPIVAGAPNWGAATAWSPPVSLTKVPGQGSVNAQTTYVLGDTLHQSLWRGQLGYTRDVPIVDGNPQWNYSPRFHITEQTRPNEYPDPDLAGGASDTFDVITYFDGFGRPIQTRQRYVNVDGVGQQDIVQLTKYNARGAAYCVTSPFAIATLPSMFQDDCANYDHTETTFDIQGRPEKTIMPDGTFTLQKYAINNATGELLFHHNVIDANQHRMKQSSNPLGQLVRVEEVRGNCASYWGYDCEAGETAWSNGPVTRYDYDMVGNLISVTDAISNVTTMTYDALGRKLTMDDPDMGLWSYVYNSSGSLVRQEANVYDEQSNPVPDGESLCFYYDEFNRLVRKVGTTTATDTCPTSLSTAPTDGVNHLASYSYGASASEWGLLKSVSWGAEPTQNRDAFTYDVLGRMTLQERFLDNRRYAVTLSNFDIFHRPQASQLFYPGGQDDVVTVTYDREGENELKVDTIPLVTDIAYDVMGRMTTFARGNNKPNTTFAYYDATETSTWAGDGNYRLKLIQHGNLGDALPDFTYHYDAVGNIEQLLTEHTDPLVGSVSDVQNFTYDYLSRLTAVSGNLNQSFAYDDIGNMTLMDGHSYGYGQASGVASGAKPHAVTHYDGAERFFYDVHGNMVSRTEDGVTYTQDFDAENRLERVTAGNEITQFFYDAAGIRTKTIQPNDVIVYTPFPNFEEEVWPNSPVVTLTADDLTTLTIKSGTSFELAWNGGNADSCTLSWSSNQAVQGTETIAGLSAGSYTYTANCQNISGSSGASVTVNVLPAPTVNLTANNVSALTIAPNTQFTMNWSSSDADYCVASGQWSGNKGVSGSQTLTGPSGGNTHTYKLTCHNAVSSTMKTVTVTAPSVPVISSFTANSQATSAWVLPNTNFTLQWSSSHAQSCSALGSWSGSKGTSGSQTITGFSGNARTYTLTCTHSISGSATKSITVSIMPTIQTQTGYVVGNKLHQGIWRGDKAWSRTVPIVNGNPDWNNATAWSGPTSSNILPGSGEIQGQSGYVLGNTLHQGLWRNNQAWVRSVPVVNGNPDWNNAGAWAGPYGNSGLPGSGNMQAQTNYIVGNTLYQSFWRGNQGWSRTVPIVNGVRNFGSASAWSGPVALSAMPGSGDIQTQSTYQVGNKLYQDIWRGHQGWSRTIPIVNGNPSWGSATAWSGPKPYSELPGGNSGGLVSLPTGYTVASNDAVIDGWFVGLSPREPMQADIATVATDPTHDFVKIAYAPSSVHVIEKSAVGKLVNRAAMQSGNPVTIQRVTYSIAGQAVAVRVSGDPDAGNNGLFYLYSDHLGSASAMQHPDGSVTQTRYMPFGGYRAGSGGNDITDRGYTGHKQNDYIKLTYMNARWYDSSIGRFISADTIVPDPTNPQTLNRYSYVLNNPINYVDPTGHYCNNPTNDREASQCVANANEISEISNGLFTLDLDNWAGSETGKILEAVKALISGLNDDIDMLGALIGGQSILIKRDLSAGLMGWDTNSKSVYVFDDMMKGVSYNQDSINWGFAHEIGHIIETTFASSVNFMKETGGSIIGNKYAPGQLDNKAETDRGAWSSNAGRGPSEDWADTFADLTVCPGCSSQLISSTATQKVYGPGEIVGGNGPGALRKDYFDHVMKQAAYSIFKHGGR